MFWRVLAAEAPGHCSAAPAADASRRRRHEPQNAKVHTNCLDDVSMSRANAHLVSYMRKCPLGEPCLKKANSDHIKNQKIQTFFLLFSLLASC